MYLVASFQSFIALIHHHPHLQIYDMNHSDVLLPSNHEIYRRLLFWVLGSEINSRRQVASYKIDREIESTCGRAQII